LFPIFTECNAFPILPFVQILRLLHAWLPVSGAVRRQPHMFLSSATHKGTSHLLLLNPETGILAWGAEVIAT